MQIAGLQIADLGLLIADCRLETSPNRKSALNPQWQWPFANRQSTMTISNPQSAIRNEQGNPQSTICNLQWLFSCCSSGRR
jgi:hypothetical protein